MVQYILNNQEAFLTLLGQHLNLTFLSVGLAMIFSIPLAIIGTRVPYLEAPIMAFGNLILHDSRFDERFPEIAESEVQIITKSGQSFLSGPVRAKGDWDYPLSEKELIEKFFWLACHAVSEQKARDIVDLIENLDEQNHINKLMSLLSQDTNQRHSLSS